MKKKFTKLLVFVSAGTIFQTGLTAFAADAQIKASTSSGARVDLQGNINEPSGAEVHAGSNLGHESLGQLERASDLIGKAIRNQQDEKLGDIKDVMVDLQSGRAPFAVMSSGGFFGVGDRLLAIPMSSFSQSADKDQLVLNMDRERMKAAPSFDKDSWPDMNDRAWNSQVSSYYQPGTESRVATETTTRTQINEPAGAEAGWKRGVSESYPESSSYGTASQVYGETTTGLSHDRTPRKGLGAEDLTKNEQKLNNPGGYAQSDAFISESSGADKPYHKTETTTTTHERREMRTENGTAAIHGGKIKRASELMGMEVKNAQGERIGEIKDVVIDMRSGRVAYTVLDAAGMDAGDKLYAVPPSVLTRSSDDRWLVFNTDKQMLMTAPSFEKNNWPQADNEQFTTEVYRFYHQQPYWQSSRQIQEPSGAEPKPRDSRDSSSEWQKGDRDNQNEYRNEIREPSGAAPESSAPSGELKEATPQSEPERSQTAPLSPRAEEQRSSAAKETAEEQSTPQYQQQQSVQQEPAGATTSTEPATSADQSNTADREMSQKLKTALETDTVLSPNAQSVQVNAANGKITLTGTVQSEQQKQAIAAKAEQIAGSADKVDNQLKVSGEATNP